MDDLFVKGKREKGKNRPDSELVVRTMLSVIEDVNERRIRSLTRLFKRNLNIISQNLNQNYYAMSYNISLEFARVH